MRDLVKADLEEEGKTNFVFFFEEKGKKAPYVFFSPRLSSLRF